MASGRNGVLPALPKLAVVDGPSTVLLPAATGPATELLGLLLVVVVVPLRWSLRVLSASCRLVLEALLLRLLLLLAVVSAAPAAATAALPDMLPCLRLSAVAERWRCNRAR